MRSVEQFLPEETINYVKNIVSPFSGLQKDPVIEKVSEESIYDLIKKLNHLEVGLIEVIVEYILSGKAKGGQ